MLRIILGLAEAQLRHLSGTIFDIHIHRTIMLL